VDDFDLNFVDRAARSSAEMWFEPASNCDPTSDQFGNPLASGLLHRRFRSFGGTTIS